MVDRLRSVARRLASGVCEIAGLERLSGGASQDTWLFTLVHGGASERLILRRQPDAVEADGLRLSAGLGVEATLLQLAQSHGVPVPRIRHVLTPEDGLGCGFIMDFVAGETLGGRIVRDDRFREARKSLAYQCGAAMAAIHQLPVSDLPKLRVGGAREEMEGYLERHRKSGNNRPVFELAFQWLRRNLQSTKIENVLVHGDFRNGNLIVGEDGLRAVLDWELAHHGDAMEDLGWICVTSWRFGGPLPVGGFGTREDLFAGYKAAGGVVDEARVHFWEVFGVLKWGIMCEGMSEAPAGGIRTVERAVIGRRSSETEIDLLTLMAPNSRSS